MCFRAITISADSRWRQENKRRERERTRQRERERERAVRVGDRVWKEKFISGSIPGRRVRGFACLGASSTQINYISQLSP